MWTITTENKVTKRCEMSEPYYKPCRELDICNELIEKYFNTQQYEKCFEGHLALAKHGDPLAECQIGYF